MSSGKVVVEYEGACVFDSTQAPADCDSILQIKKYIEKKRAIPAGSQLISLENILLQEDLKMEDLRFNHHGEMSD